MTSLNALASKSVPYLLAALGVMASLIWSDVKETLGEVRLIKFQQIKDGKDLERHDDEIRSLKADVRELQMPRARKMGLMQAIYGGAP